ncbi:hypothetical protein [Paraglaciecola marina]|uniref:hypothetical protein n=1 Tax=Paraglaciecola marina TaxID=2500157 RepID=UPI00105B8BFB|nr:hypothetical protein [Paraglaciecola marina]
MGEHGQYVSSRSQQLMLFSGRGPWNDEALTYGTKSTQADLQAIDHNRPWGQIGFLYGESLMPPTAFKLFSDVISLRQQMGLKAIAIMIQDSDIITTIKTQLKVAYNKAGIESEFFNDFDSATKWLSQFDIEFNLAEVNNFYLSNQFIDNQ